MSMRLWLCEMRVYRNSQDLQTSISCSQGHSQSKESKGLWIPVPPWAVDVVAIITQAGAPAPTKEIQG